MLSRHSGPGWVMSGVLLYIPIYILFYIIFLKNKKRDRKILWTLLFLIVFLLIDLTQFPWPLGKQAQEHVRLSHEFSYNLVPLENIYWNMWRSFRLQFLIENFGNIIVFMPFGFVLTALLAKRRWVFLKVLLSSFIFSFGIEFMQLLSSYYGLNVRVFDVDDLIMNTVGGVFGFIAFIICRKIYRRWKTKQQHTKN